MASTGVGRGVWQRLGAASNDNGARAMDQHIETLSVATKGRTMTDISAAIAKRLTAAREAFVDVVAFIAANTRSNPNAAFAGSVPYLLLAGNLMAGWQMARALLVAEDQLAAGVDAAFMQSKITTAHFYADHILSRVPGLRDSIVDGAGGVTTMALESF